MATKKVVKGKKRCCICDKTLLLSCFTNSKSRPDGLSNRCRQCDTSDYKKWREENRKRYNEKQYRHMANFPEKERARRMVNYRVKSGLIKRLPCQQRNCGKIPTHAHHSDYSKPLDVMWLCVPHHAKIHHDHAK